MSFDRRVAVALSACSIAAACTGSDPVVGGTGIPDAGGSDAGAEAAATGSFTLRAPGTAIITPNETTKIPIEIERLSGFGGAVKIMLQPALDGIAFAPLTLDGTVTKGELVITAAATAKDTITKLQLVASADPGLSDTKDLPFVVRGVAGKREMTYGEKDGFTILPSFRAGVIARAADDGVLLADGATVVHVLADGKPDTAFGTGGKTDLKAPSGRTVSLRVAKDGAIYVFVYTTDRKNAAVHRLAPNGAYDTKYGVEGVAVYDFATPGDQPNLFGGDIDSTGRAVLGMVPGLVSTSIFVRFLADGKPDSAFNAENRTTTNGGWRELRVADTTPVVFGAGFYDSGSQRSTYALALVTGPASAEKKLAGEYYIPDVRNTSVDSKGRMLLAGNGSEQGTGDTTVGAATIVRANADGSLDGTFASGIVAESLDGNAGTHPAFVAAFEEPSTGKVIGIGHRLLGVDYVPTQLLARYGENGAPDPTFGTNGIVLEDVPLAGHSTGGYLQEIPTIVAARAYDPSGTLLARYWR